MTDKTDILDLIKESAEKRILFLFHAVRQMSKPDRMITTKEKIMKCMHCQGKMNKAAAPFHVDRKGYHLTLDTVPAWVCGQCGEIYFDEPEIDSIQEIIQALEGRTEKLSAVA